MNYTCDLDAANAFADVSLVHEHARTGKRGPCPFPAAIDPQRHVLMNDEDRGCEASVKG